MYDALRVHYANGKREYRRWLAKGLGIVREEMIVDGKRNYEKRLANRVTIGDSGFKRIATRTARVRLSRLEKPVTDGHIVLPARFDHQGDDWKENATMLQIDLEAARDPSRRQYATATFTSLRAPHDWLSVGKALQALLEKRRVGRRNRR